MRYFLVFYTSITKAGQLYGTNAIELDNFPNCVKLHELIKETNNLDSVVVTNILEISKTDFKNWKNELEP